MPTPSDQHSPVFLTLHDKATQPPSLSKQWSSDQGTLEIGRAPKDKGKEAQDPATPFFRSNKTKVMSSSHARIEWVEGVPHLSDLGSTNGTFINQVQLYPGESRKILDGNEITFGRLVASRHEGGQSGEPLVLVASISKSPISRASLNSFAPPSPTLNSPISYEEANAEEEPPSLVFESEEEDILASSEKESSPAPQATQVQPRSSPCGTTKSGFGLSEEDLLASSSQGEQDEDAEEDDKSEDETRRVPYVRPSKMSYDPIPSPYFDYSTFKLSRLRRGRQRSKSVDRSVRDDSDARSPYSSRPPSPVSPDEHPSIWSTTVAQDLCTSTSVELETGPPRPSQAQPRFASKDSFKRPDCQFGFPRPVRGILPITKRSFAPVPRSSETDDVERKKEVEGEILSQASPQLPSPRLSSSSSSDEETAIKLELTDEEEEKVEGATEKKESMDGQVEKETSPAVSMSRRYMPKSPAGICAFMDKCAAEGRAKAETQVGDKGMNVMEEKVDSAPPSEASDVGQACSSDGSEMDEDIDFFDDETEEGEEEEQEEGDGEEEEELDFDGDELALFEEQVGELKGPVKGITDADLTSHEVEEGLFESEIDDDGFGNLPNKNEPTFFGIPMDPDVDFGPSFEVDEAGSTGDPDFADAMDEDLDDYFGCSEYPIGGDAVAKKPIEKEEQELPIKVDAPRVPSPCPEVSAAGDLSQSIVFEASQEDTSPTMASGQSTPSRKRPFSEVDVEEEETVEPLSNDTRPTVITPVPKRRRIAAHIATFAVGLFTGVVGAIAGLSALGAALDEE
ncbi:hypothetical protein JCM16303_003835 [Sporobolomyces ruberrimus]